MLRDILYAIDQDLTTIEKSDKDIFSRKVEDKINNNLELYKEKIKKTFKYMIDVNVLANQSGLKKLVKKEGLK